MDFSIKRLLEFFKWSPDQKPDVPPLQKSCLRSYDRYPIEFEVIVTMKDQDGRDHRERGELHDVSGGGALFMSRIPDKYFPGQRLKLEIFLAGTEDVRACIKTEAAVVRIHPVGSTDGSAGDSRAGIAVQFYQPFEFERMDHSFFGSFL
jgi:hypothetical protein